jgi:D-glycero-alpha-D-manno-heptose-7-phosphate kinase
MELSDIALEGYSILESNNDINEFGRLLDRAWEIKKKISVVSTEKVDMFYRWVKSLGAIGGKLIGSGRGGFFLVFADPGILEQIGRSTVYVPVRFEYNGATVLEV